MLCWVDYYNIESLSRRSALELSGSQTMNGSGSSPRFGVRLRQLRSEKGLSQRELAGLVGIDFTYLSKVENGHGDSPGEATIRRLAEALSADPDELLAIA